MPVVSVDMCMDSREASRMATTPSCIGVLHDQVDCLFVSRRLTRSASVGTPPPLPPPPPPHNRSRLHTLISSLP
jgi:hypothetical protein